MTKLSICIPVEPGKSAPVRLCETLLANEAADIEIVVAPYGDVLEGNQAFADIVGRDKRLRTLPPAPENISLAQFWIGTVAAMDADWAVLVRPDDMLEAGIEKLLEAIETSMPDADVCGWNTFTINAAAPRHVPAAIPVPVQHHAIELDKVEMMDAFFHWSDSSNVPKMPLGIYHCAIRRALLESVLNHSGETSWLTPVPQYEWAARVILHCNRIAFYSRPLSAIAQEDYKPVKVPRVIANFPFSGAIGITAAIAEIQCRVLHQFNATWDGYGDAFIRACMIDCMFENDQERFEEKAEAYFIAINEMGVNRLTTSFRPPYLKEPKADRRRGLHGRVMLVDRFLGNATTAQDFYAIARYMLTPVNFIAEGGNLAEMSPSVN